VAVGKIQQRFIRPYASSADALAFRLKRTQEPELRTVLALALASFAKDDLTVKTFIENNLTLVPEADVPTVKHLIEHGSPDLRSRICRDLFSKAS
jgi:hypothetical protein